MTIIFVGGVHGVGKSTCCALAAEQIGCIHVSASDVIRKQRAAAIAASGKLVADVSGNQDLLLRGFAEVKKLAGVAPILLDGHFALMDSDRVIQSLSPDVFADLGVGHLVCYIDDVQDIVQRMGLRDGQVPDVGEVAVLQGTQLRNAEAIAAALRIPLTVLHGFDIEGLKRVVARMD